MENQEYYTDKNLYVYDEIRKCFILQIPVSSFLTFADIESRAKKLFYDNFEEAVLRVDLINGSLLGNLYEYFMIQIMNNKKASITLEMKHE